MMQTKYFSCRSVFCALLITTLLGDSAAQESVISPISVNTFGGISGLSSSGLPPHISPDGRYVCFDSDSNDLVGGDTNGVMDSFIRDRHLGTTERVSVSSAGVQGDLQSYYGRCSADGRFVVFQSAANNFAGDNSGLFNVFLRDRTLGMTTCLTLSAISPTTLVGGVYPDISRDGRYIVFQSDSNALDLNHSFPSGNRQIFRHDRITGVTQLVSVDAFGTVGNGPSRFPRISGDGRTVSFYSTATNLVPGDTNNKADYFVHEPSAGITERLSVDSLGQEATQYWSTLSYQPAELSADGRYALFLYNGNDLVAGDTQLAPDVFLRDRLLGTTERVNVNSNGEEAQYVSSGGWYNRGSISDNGRYVVFRSFASNLVPSAAAPWDNVYIRDRWKGITKAVPVTSSGVVGNLQSSVGSCSADGRYVAFASTSSNLVPGDTNGWGDVFVRDMMIGGPELSVSNAIAGQSAQLTLGGGSPSGVVFVGASVMGQGLMASPWGPLDLAGPLALFVFAMDASGSVNAQVPIPLALVGRPLWVQGLDVSMNYPTSTWAGWIQ